jgi:glyoxylase I family protein
VPWYKALFGSDPILDEDTGPFKRVAWLTGGTIVGLTQFPDLSSTEPFNERRPGLDHLAFGCANRDELKAWEIRLNELGIPNGGIVDPPSYSALHFETPTTSHSSSSHLGARTGGVSVCPIGRPTTMLTDPPWWSRNPQR